MYSGKNGVSIQQAPLPPSAAMIRDIIWLPEDCTRTHEPLVKHKSGKGETRPGVDRVKPFGLPPKRNELWVVENLLEFNVSPVPWNEIWDSGTWA